MRSVILVTGASSGIGNLTVRALAQAGYTVYAGMRDCDGRNAQNVKELHDWSLKKNYNLCAVELDVLCQESVDAAVQSVQEEQGKIDVLIHNAGHLVLGPTEAFTPEEIVKVFDTNVLGSQRVNRAVLPLMRKQEAGLLLWISSTTVRGGFPPFMGPYVAAKAALDALAVTLSYELARFGIETSIVVPGAFTQGTAHFPNAGKPADQARADIYKKRYENLLEEVGARLSALTPDNSNPQVIADEIVRIVALPRGTRPSRSVIDFIHDGAEEVTELAEKVREEFSQRIGIEDLLKPTLKA